MVCCQASGSTFIPGTQVGVSSNFPSLLSPRQSQTSENTNLHRRKIVDACLWSPAISSNLSGHRPELLATLLSLFVCQLLRGEEHCVSSSLFVKGIHRLANRWGGIPRGWC